ncbi:S8 family serine peptidase, partial [Nocardioides sp.]|uniref:S8 family serine peptidase n=1 Tax=Nocardioides sp. TaxID=35761 RepID=UPI00286DE9CE
QVATSWAAAEVSGVVALLRSHYPRDTAKQVVARLMATTEGSETALNPWTGAGVVQAHDALTRSLDPGRGGRIERSTAQDRRDSTPPPAPTRLDLFGSSRALLLWFGLAGGALMALAFMLRSLTRR